MVKSKAPESLSEHVLADFPIIFKLYIEFFKKGVKTLISLQLLIDPGSFSDVVDRRNGFLRNFGIVYKFFPKVNFALKHHL